MSAPLPGTTEEEAVKAKRSGRVERMLASLSEDELDALRDRLSDHDGEVVSLKEVLHQRRGR
jgi:hypothetical protein